MDYSRIICKVVYKEQVGTGAIYKCECPEGIWRTLFITSNEIVENINANDLTGLRLIFENKTIENFNLTPEWVKFFWTSPREEFNVTIIEFSTAALKVLSRSKYVPFVPASPRKNGKVTIYEIDKNGAVVNGIISNVIEDESLSKPTIEFTMGTALSSINAGAPLLNEDFNVVGILYNSLLTQSTVSELTVHQAVNIQRVLDGFRKHVNEQLEGKPKDEVCIERIDRVPKSELRQIGTGGFGRVFKVNETNANDIAMKIVNGLGGPKEYEEQIRALEREYRAVSLLGSHPRIIQVFAIVPDERNFQILVVMEYMEGGSLADKLQGQKPIAENLVLKYLYQLLEGVSFLHAKQIYHSDIKPANILFSAKDELKISDFGISGGNQLDIKSGTKSAHTKGDFRYMSPERLQGANRRAANDIWSVGAILVHMVSGKPLNHPESVTKFLINITQYKITITGIPYREYLEALQETDFKRKVMTQTLCPEATRADSQRLLRILFSYSTRIPEVALRKESEPRPLISGMCYNSERDELFLADWTNRVVRVIGVRVNDGDLRDVFGDATRDSYPQTVCYLSDSDTLLVGSYLAGKEFSLVALSRSGSEWREAQRLQLQRDSDSSLIASALSDSRVLIGQRDSKYLELFQVESGARIAPIHRIHVPEEYKWFSATSGGSETLVAMSFNEKEEDFVRVHRLCGDQLNVLASVKLEGSCVHHVWLAGSLFVTQTNSDWSGSKVVEFKVNLKEKELENCKLLIAPEEGITVSTWCALDNGLAIVDWNSDELLYRSSIAL